MVNRKSREKHAKISETFFFFARAALQRTEFQQGLGCSINERGGEKSTRERKGLAGGEEFSVAQIATV